MPYDYHTPPTQVRPVEQMKKYFYTVLFVKSYVYNVKGQAIIFRRKSLESLMKLLSDFDETYLHSSYEHSYQNKVLSEGNVDFLVRFTDNLDDVISLIDQNAYTIKLSWQPQRVPQPYPPHPIPVPPPYPHPTPGNILNLVNQAVLNALNRKERDHMKRVKVVAIDTINMVVEVRLWDDVKKKFIGNELQVNVGAYSDTMPDWRVGDDALLIDGKYLQRINDTPNYRRVKIIDVNHITTDTTDPLHGRICVREYDDVNKVYIGDLEWINIEPYEYGTKTPAWKAGDDALLFDNKYLTKIDTSRAEEEGGGSGGGWEWGDPDDDGTLPPDNTWELDNPTEPTTDDPTSGIVTPAAPVCPDANNPYQFPTEPDGSGSLSNDSDTDCNCNIGG